MAARPAPTFREFRPIPIAGMTRRGTEPASRGQYIDYRVVAENLGAITQTTLPVQESQKYAQPRDNMNFLERYNNRAMEMHTEIFTAEMMNEKANLTLSICAPVMFMTEHHVTFSSREYFMLPFDVAAVGGVPRRTFHHKSERTVSMQHYNRYQSMELNYLLDRKFGQQMLEETLGVIIAQARLTLYFQFAWGIVVCALEQSFDSFRNSKSSALYMHNQTSFFAIANASPNDFNLKLVQLREPQRNYDTLLIPEYAGPHLNEIAKERSILEGYHYDYDESTERLLLATFKALDGVPSIPMASGGYMSIVQNVALRYSNTGPERMRPTQTLEGYATLCEVVLQPPISPDEEPSTGPTDLYDPVSYDQTESNIEHNAFDVAAAHSACGFWNNDNGTMKIDNENHDKATNPAGFGNIYTGIIANMRKDKNAVAWLEGSTFGNDTPSTADWEKGSLEEMDFRKFPWATVSEFVDTEGRRVKEVVTADYILSLPEKAFPTAHVKRMVRGLHRAWKRDFKDLSVDQFMHMALPDHDLDARNRNPADIKKPKKDDAIDKPLQYRSQREDLFSTFEKSIQPLRKALKAAAEEDIVKLLGKFNKHFQNDLDERVGLQLSNPRNHDEMELDTEAIRRTYKPSIALLADFRNEFDQVVPGALAGPNSKDEYDAVRRVVPSESELDRLGVYLQNFVNEMNNPRDGNKVVFDMKIPKSHVAHFETAYQRMEQEKTRSKQDAGRFAAVARGADAVLAALRETSGKEGSRNVIEDFAAHLERGGSVADFGNGKVSLLTVRTKSRDRPIPSSEMSQVEDFAQPSDDAMDIDEPPAFGIRAQATFGAYGKSDLDADDMEKIYPILVKRLEASPFKGHQELNDIYYLLGRSYFSHNNVYSLQKNFGLQIYRLNFWRPWQRYRMYHMVAMVRGPRTMVTGFASPIVHPAFQGMEGYINIVAQFFSALIVAQRNNVKFIPNVMAAGLLSDINTQFVRSSDEALSQNVHKPSTIPEPVPLDETKYQWPLHMLNKEVSHHDDPQAASPFSIHSGAPFLVGILGKGYLESSWSEALEGDPMTSMDISLVGHRSWAMYLDKRLGRYNIIPGTSPRGQSYHNAIESAAVWAGAAVRFPTSPSFTKPVST